MTGQEQQLLRQLIERFNRLERRVGLLDTQEVTSGSGAVDSVNGATGVVVLDADDIAETVSRIWFTTAEETKLTGIEANADVTDATNVAAAGAVMDSELIDTSAGAADAGKPIKLDAAGHVDATMINDADINLDNVTEGATNKFFTATEKTKLAGIETGADVTDAANIASSITGASTDDTIADADVFGYLTGGALVKTAWSNIKTVLKTYFDTLYGLLATANTWVQNQTIASTQTTGNALRVVRDLAAASTDAPVVDVVQDNASDDQPLIRGQQDGSGDILVLYDGATIVLRLLDGGQLLIGNPVATTRRVEIGDGGVSGGAVIRTSSTTDNGIIFHDENAANDEWLISHVVSNNSLRLAGWRTGTSGSVSEYVTVLPTGEVGVGPTLPTGKLHVDQASTTAAIPALLLDQADLSEEMIEFATTVGAGNPIDTAAVGTYYGKVRVNVTGVGYKYIALYNT